MIEVRIDASAFRAWLRKAGEDFEARARQALGQSTALALAHAKATTLFKDGTGEGRKGPHLRQTIVRFQRSTWATGIKATARHAKFVEDDTRPHRIEARRAKALRFVWRGQLTFRRGVNHPGTTGTHFMAKAGEVGRRALEDFVERAARHAFRP